MTHEWYDTCVCECITPPIPLKGPGESCLEERWGHECASGECDCNGCHPLPDGHACATDDNCSSKHCHGIVTLGCYGVCGPAG